MKKKSLFSQKIKQARSKKSEAEDSFPKAISINLSNQQLQLQIAASKMQIENQEAMQECEKINEAQQRGFVNKLLMSQLNENEIQKLQEENDKSILQMSQQQRQKYRDLIVKQIPQKLLRKLTKKKKQQIEKTQMIDEKNQQIMDQKPQDSFQGNANDFNLKQIQSQKIQQRKQEIVDKYSQNQSSLDNILLNVKSGEIIFNYTEYKVEQSQILSIKNIKVMIQSQNNQTQIVASRLINQLCKFLFSKNFVKENNFIEFPLVKIGHENFHLYKLAQDFYEKLIKSLIWQLKRTNFKSCWTEMVSVFTNFIILASKWIKLSGTNGSKLISQFNTSIQEQIERKNHFFEHSQQNCKDDIIDQQLREASIQLNKAPINEDSLIDLIKMKPSQSLNLLIVQFLQPNYSSLLKLISQRFSKTVNEILKFRYFIQSSYPFLLELEARDKKANQMRKEIKQYKQWIHLWFVSELKSDFFKDKLTKQQFNNIQEQEILFKYLHSLRILSLRSFSIVLKDQSQENAISVINPILANQLILLNIEQYFVENQTHDKNEIDNLSLMFEFLIKKLSENQQNYLKNVAVFLLVDMFSIFCSPLPLSSHQSLQQKIGERQKITYQDLDQNLLDQALNCLCLQVCLNKKQEELWKTISDEKLKWLISCYNYSSFGNYCFTKLILFLAASCPFSSTKSMILQEVMSRYPFLFCYAAKQGVYGPQKLYLNGYQMPEMRQIYEIVRFNKKIQQDNMFVRFLLQK